MVFTEEEFYYMKKIPNFDVLKNSKFANKRICHEILSIKKCIDYNEKCNRGARFKNIEPMFIEFNIIDEKIISFSILFKYKYNISFQLTFNSQYPFRGPSCKISNNDYKMLLARISEHYKGTEKKNDSKCLCCSTLLCRDNWNPGSTISSILEEVDTNTTYIYDIVYKMLENKIYDKYLGYQLL